MFKSHIKLAALKELSKGECSGYDLMKEEGVSPGYIYPLLRELEKTGHITMRQVKRRTLYKITALGRRSLNDLVTKHERMTKSLIESYAPIADRKELDRYIKFRTRIKEHKMRLLRTWTCMRTSTMRYSRSTNRKTRRDTRRCVQ